MIALFIVGFSMLFIGLLTNFLNRSGDEIADSSADGLMLCGWIIMVIAVLVGIAGVPA